MQIERFYLGCLAHASYLVHDGGEAAVIDPQRDVDIYVARAAELGVRVRWVVETHLHADFVSGHLELARRTGAEVCLGTGANAAFPHRDLDEDQCLPLGAGFLRILSTPGHTEESICILAHPAADADPLAVFTGDTLFIGDVGRPDLSPTRSPQELAGVLYDSLHEKLLKLPDATIVYPAHGAGSLCGRNMSTDTSSTIGRERAHNYALQTQSREQFVDLLTAELPARPAYFADDVARNREGAAPLEELPPLRSLSPVEVRELQGAGAVVLDTRPVMEFAVAHVPGSIHIALNGQFASWAARMFGSGNKGVDVPVLLLAGGLVADDDAVLHETRLRLSRVGIDHTIGALDGGIHSWLHAGFETSYIAQITPVELAEWLEQPPEKTVIVDVREPAEHASGSIPGAISIPLGQLRARLEDIERGPMVFVHCKGGYRSSIASSVLQSSGFPKVANVTGGYDAWKLTVPTHKGGN